MRKKKKKAFFGYSIKTTDDKKHQVTVQGCSVHIRTYARAYR